MPIEIRLIPASPHAASCSAVQSVGLASIVISGPGTPENRARIAAIARAMQAGRHSDGVPPPR
jgi:hypothetical protein